MAPKLVEESRNDLALETAIFESYCLRKIVTYNLRLTRRLECFDSERALLGLHRILTYPLTPEEKQTRLWLLADVLARIPKHWHLIRSLGDIEPEVFPGLPNFCFNLQRPENTALKNMWEQVIINHARSNSHSISSRRGQIDTGFSHFRAAKENWEWACFQHYRDSFRLWILSGNNACEDCRHKLSYIGKAVEYDDYDESELYFMDLGLIPGSDILSHIGCLPTPPTSITTNIPSLEPFIAILTCKAEQNEGVDRRWLELWRPFVEMHVGHTISELRMSLRYMRSPVTVPGEPLAVFRTTPGPTFNAMDLEYVVCAVYEEGL